MNIKTKQNSDAMEVLELEGDLDFNSSAEVRAALAKPVDKQIKKILINLSLVGYVDSSGLAVFVEVYQKLKRYGGKLILFNLSDSVRSVFEIAKLDSIFQLAASEKDALAS